MTSVMKSRIGMSFRSQIYPSFKRAVKMKIPYKIKGLRFGRHGADDLSVAIARGNVIVNGISWKFELILAPIAKGEWRLVHLASVTGGFTPPVLREKQLRKELVNTTARLLYTINMWPSEQNADGARISVNERVIPEGVRDKVIVSYRPDILDVPSAHWDHLWDHIERRVDADPFFEVLGFDKTNLQRVLPLLREIFPGDWVRARYAAAGLTGMAGQFEPGADGWFPAYHLARTAHGAICRDPGWNYLVEIGLAIEALRDFDGVDRLKQQLTRSPGTQHHICLAADLHERGILKGLEPATGAGAATSDLLAGVDGRLYQIEVKEFRSNSPAKQLRRNIADKVKKLPGEPEQPVVFFVVLIEDGEFNKQLEDDFFDTVTELESLLPEKISAVVAGKRFVDSKGGPVKRDIERVVINPKAIMPVDEEGLRTIFQANYQNASHPFYGIGTFFMFGKKRS
jgi:hypothetical protein